MDKYKIALKRKIEIVRNELYSTIKESTDLHKKSVIRKSRELDKLINKYEEIECTEKVEKSIVSKKNNNGFW